MSAEFRAHHRICRRRNPLTEPGESSGFGMSGTLANAKAAKYPPQANRYVNDRPKGIVDPVQQSVRMMD